MGAWAMFVAPFGALWLACGGGAERAAGAPEGAGGAAEAGRDGAVGSEGRESEVACAQSGGMSILYDGSTVAARDGCAWEPPFAWRWEGAHLLDAGFGLVAVDGGSSADVDVLVATSGVPVGHVERYEPGPGVSLLSDQAVSVSGYVLPTTRRCFAVPEGEAAPAAGGPAVAQECADRFVAGASRRGVTVDVEREVACKAEGIPAFLVAEAATVRVDSGRPLAVSGRIRCGFGS